MAEYEPTVGDNSAEAVYERKWARGILNGMQWQKLYEGTVSVVEVARRRAKNKRARRSRKINRR